MVSLVSQRGRAGRESIYHYFNIMSSDHNERTFPTWSKHAEKKKKKRIVWSKNKPAPVTPPRDNTPHFDEQYREAPTPSSSPSYLRRSRRFREQRQNASPSETQRDQLLASFSKMSIKQNQNN